jgi:multisubunit Na+/H+ antiporter MnhB subunit|tara:strand:+ start:122 stop:319 length:198 start_codon:yes stop_codon:yes gene_type:complete
MKYFYYIFIGIAIILIAYNVTFLDFSNLIEGQSRVALIGIVTGACAILLVLILRTSKKIAKKKRY